VDCLAIVTNGGLNDTLFEDVTEDDEMALKDLAQLKTEYPEIYEEVLAEAREEAKGNEKMALAIAERDAAQVALHEAKEELAKRDEEAKRAAAKQAIVAKANELKVVCSEDLLEALLLIPEDKAVGILQGQPKLKEDLEEQKKETPKQRGGLGSKPRSTRTDWITKFAGN
jgi:hypothetical protein